MLGLRTIAVTGVVAAIFVTATPANATIQTVFEESFESCTHDESPGYSGINMALDSPTTVDIWYDESTPCEGWTFTGSAWLTRRTAGTAFPDGDYALWLNELPHGVATYDLSGLTPDTEYTLSFDVATDNDVNAPYIFVFVTLVSAMPSWTIELESGQTWMHVERTFVTDDTTAELNFVGSAINDASPVIDNISVTYDDSAMPSSVDSPTEGLAHTGFDAQLAVAGAVALAAGGLVLRRQGRTRR